MIARYPGKCRRCGIGFEVGASVRYSNLTKQTFCVGCWGTKAERIASDQNTMAGIMARATEAHAAARASEAVPTEKPQDGLGQAQAVPVPVDSSEGDASYLAPLAAALARHMSLPAGHNMDAAMVETLAETVARRVLAEQETPAPTVIEVRRPEAPTVTLEHAHYLMPRLLRVMGAGMHVYLWGPAGTGKTTAALQAAHALRGPEGGEIDTLDQSTPKSSIMGYRTPTGDPVGTAFSRCWIAGHFYIADETDNAPANVQTIFNSALANGHAPLAWGSVARGEGFGFAGTGNTPGRPTPMFPDRRPMSAAFADRLYFMNWPLDAAIECRVGGLKAPKAPEREESTCTPGEWVRWVQRVRTWSETNVPTLMVTPRASILGIQALAIGETPTEVAHGLVFRGADNALVTKVLNAVPLPG
jgi:hypothetical protein